MNALEVCA